MEKSWTRSTLKAEIKRLEIQSKIAKSYSGNRLYPQDSRDRFKNKYLNYSKQIEELEKELQKATGPEEVENTIDNQKNSIEESITLEEDMEVEDREEIDFSDSYNAMDALHSLYPDGLDLD